MDFLSSLLKKMLYCRCLQETDWNFEKATAIFNEINGQGRIPPEAFVKNEPL